MKKIIEVTALLIGLSSIPVHANIIETTKKWIRIGKIVLCIRRYAKPVMVVGGAATVIAGAVHFLIGAENNQ